MPKRKLQGIVVSTKMAKTVVVKVERIKEHTKYKKFSVDYFNDIEHRRYTIEPEIFSFAQFTRYRNQKVLEVGIGAGTDFVQWVRAGAKAYGVD